jgi:hypothetical protein
MSFVMRGSPYNVAATDPATMYGTRHCSSAVRTATKKTSWFTDTPPEQFEA